MDCIDLSEVDAAIFAVFKVFFTIFLTIYTLFLPVEWISNSSFYCYGTQSLPKSGSIHNQLALINRMYWGWLPIQELCPLISNHAELKETFPSHCCQITYKQLLWMAENSRSELEDLLKDAHCVGEIDWRHLDVADYRKYFRNLKIYNISNFSHIYDEVIRAGLHQIGYFFPTASQLAMFLENLFFKSRRSDAIFDLFNDIFAFDLFDIDAIVLVHK